MKNSVKAMFVIIILIIAVISSYYWLVPITTPERKKEIEFVIMNNSSNIKVIQNYTYKIINVYPHDSTAFTQGLVFEPENGFLYESTGLYGNSTLRKVDLSSGEVLQIQNLNSNYFGEGITILGNKIIQLTWKSNIGLVYDKNTFELNGTFNYSIEGWGITNDKSKLIMSDGTETLYFLDPNTYQEQRRVKVVDNTVNSSVTHLNELEFINGEIYANVWKTDKIARIDPKDGKVIGWIDLNGLLSHEERNGSEGVLNGIAYDEKNQRLFVTGKFWPKIFEIELVKME